MGAGCRGGTRSGTFRVDRTSVHQLRRCGGRLAELVEQVLERLSEEGLPTTRLAQDWAALGRLDDAEKEFCATAARLGLDPFAVSDELAKRNH